MYYVGSKGRGVVDVQLEFEVIYKNQDNLQSKVISLVYSYYKV